MAYPPPPPSQPPFNPAPDAGPHTDPPPTPKRNWVPWVVGGVVSLALICCGGFITLVAVAPPTPAEQPPVAAPPPPTRRAAQPTAPATTAPPTTPPAPATAVMPKLVGLNAAVAVDKLEKLGFLRENIRLGTQDEYDNWVLLPENWTVAKQSEKPGAKVPLDAVIALTCTKEQ